MKKLLSAAMALVIGLSMSAAVLAENGVGGNEYPYSDEAEIKIEKVIELTNEGTVNPAETFEFVVGEGSYSGPVADTTAPAFDPNTFSIDIAQGVLLGSEDINLPTFTAIGEYTYPITENAGSTAGFVYDDATYYLKITVINDGDGGFKRVVTLVDGKDVKTDAFDNEFNAGSLVVKKEITGNFSQKDDKFVVTVTLTPENDKVIKEGPITVTGAVDQTGNLVKDDDGVVTVTFTVTHDSTVTIANVPYDVSYKVTEEAGDYTATITGDNGEINKAKQEVEIVNTLDQQIATGVNLDNLPYILVLALVSLGLISFTVRKRVRN